MSMFNFPGGSTTVNVLAAVSAANTAAATSSAVDTNDYEGGVIVIQNKGAGTGTLDGKLQDSADGSTDWQDVSGLSIAQRTTGAAIDTIVFQKRAVRRYVRYVGTIGTGPQLVAVSLTAHKKLV